MTFSGVFSFGAPLTKVGAAKLMPTEFVCCGQHTFVEVSVEGVKYFIECTKFGITAITDFRQSDN